MWKISCSGDWKQWKSIFPPPKPEGKIIPALTAYTVWRCPKPEDTTCFKNFSCHLCLCLASTALADSVQPSPPEDVIILRCNQWQLQRQGFNFSLCFGESRRWGNKTICPARPTRRCEESRKYLCLLAVLPLLPSLGPPFRPPHCPQGRRGSALAGCGGSSGVVAETPSSLQGLRGGGKMLGGGQQSCSAPPARKRSRLCI